MINYSASFDNTRRILVTGGAGFIGGAIIRRLLKETHASIFNLDKYGYASDLTSIDLLLSNIGKKSIDRYHFMRVDLSDHEKTLEAIRYANPDLVLHLAAESHVDRSIDSPKVFLESNVIGTFNLLQAVLLHWEGMPNDRKNNFRFHHISTDEVFGSLGEQGYFSENTSYDPRSPYSASKAASDHFVNAWHHTYGLPIILTNCSNNYGPWQFPEKLIPVVILKALAGDKIPLYGDGENVRDWLYVEDHVDALLLAATQGIEGRNYCIGGYGECTNKKLVELICDLLDERIPVKHSYKDLITKVIDRPGHDLRYAINSSRITNELGWKPLHDFNSGLKKTVDWYLANRDWCYKTLDGSGYGGERIGLKA